MLERLEPGHELAMAFNLRAAIAILDENSDEALTWATRALELAEQVDSVEARVSALGALGLREALQGSHEGRTQIEEALALAQEAELENQIGPRLRLPRNGCVPRAVTCCDAAIAHACARILRGARSRCLGRRSPCDARLARAGGGRLGRDERHRVAGLRADCNLSTLQMLVVLGLLRARRGDPDAWTPLNRARGVADEQASCGGRRGGCRESRGCLARRRARRASQTSTEAAFAVAIERRASWPIAELGYWRSERVSDVGAFEKLAVPSLRSCEVTGLERRKSGRSWMPVSSGDRARRGR